MFIPLKTEYFLKFKNGQKTDELRMYGKRWNEQTCLVGREVTLSKGYGKHERLQMVITRFERQRLDQLPKQERADFSACYGDEVTDVARIKLAPKKNEKQE